VSINIANLEDDELGLVDAIEGMVTHTQQKSSGPYGTAFQVLNWYGCDGQRKGEVGM
jgi:hypothetical protein